MSTVHVPKMSSQDLSRCREKKGGPAFDEELSPSQKADARIQQSINEAFRKDGVIRATEYPDFDAEVEDATVYLHGHITDESGLNRILKALERIPDVKKVANHLVRDDQLTHQVSAMLAELQESCDCVFRTGATHGVVVLSGHVPDAETWKAAERIAASHPQVRGVSNYLRAPGISSDLQERRFVQPASGTPLKFQDGTAGTVKQVVIRPDDRRVSDVVLQGEFPTANEPKESLIVVSTDLFSYLTKETGALMIESSEYDKYTAFDPAQYTSPPEDWIPPYPYCSDEVLFRRDG